MHLTSQFQLLLGGTMDFPKSTMKLRPLAVHYADHNLPYGPFSTGEGHEMLVLHPKQGGLVSMADRAARKQINLAGRQLVAMEKDCEWFQFAEQEGALCKFLIPPGAGPEATIVAYAPNALMPVPAAPFGRYEVVLDGSIVLEGRALGTAALRYVVGDEQPAPLQIGPDGASLMLLSFDADAAAGGIGNDQLSRAAAEAIERAI
jgi:hypothetical protein